MDEPRSPIQRIRTRTRAQHERVERLLGSRYFEDSDFDRANFLDLLRTYYGLYSPLESRLVSAQRQFLPEFSYEPRSERLESDLRSLGFSGSDLDSIPTLSPSSMVPLQGRDQLLGCLYVIEGAEHGNTVIRGMLEETLDPRTLRADSFFRHAPGEMKQRWERFSSLFNRTIENGPPLRRAVQSARDTFEMFEDWFQ